MDNNNIPEEDYKKLYIAFINAISSSEEIKAIVEDLKKREQINSVSMFALIIKLEELLKGSALSAKTNLPLKQRSEAGKYLKAALEGEYIDGEKLSPNEIAFEEFCRNDFDEDKWLKENRLKF